MGACGESFDWEAPILLTQLGMDMKELHADDVLTTKPGLSSGRIPRTIERSMAAASAQLHAYDRP